MPLILLNNEDTASSRASGARPSVAHLDPRLDDPRLSVFSGMTDSELKDPKQMIGLALAVENHDAQATAPAPDLRKQLSSGLFIAESKNVIERALNSGCECFALFVEECWRDQSAPLIERLLQANPQTPIFVATAAQRARITGYQSTRGPLAAFHRATPAPVTEILKNARRVAVLEDITNFTNIGAIFRSAAALGIDAVLVTPSCHDPLYRRASRVSMGTVFQVPWTYIGTAIGIAANPGNNSAANWATEGIPLLHSLGFKTAAMALSDDSIPLQDKRLQACDKLALVLGTEGDGLAASTIAACDYTVRIPMDHGVDSLNVAAASAVAFWELRVNHRD